MDLNDAASHRSMLAPVEWPWALTAAPATTSEGTSWQGALLRSWRDTSASMVQPALEQHCIVMHLGGPKRVTRRNDGAPVSGIAEIGSLTIVPAGTAYLWNTEGPIAFAHLYLRPSRLAGIAGEALHRDGDRLQMVDRLACRDPLLELLLSRMLNEIRIGHDPSKLLLDALLESLCVRLARKHVSGPASRTFDPVALAPHRLKRVLDYVDAHLGCEIALADLVAAAGSSQYHFSRAFHIATGFSPYRYVLHRRVEVARAMLIASTESLEAIGVTCGFSSKHQFSTLFKRELGVGPKRFRLSLTGKRSLES